MKRSTRKASRGKYHVSMTRISMAWKMKRERERITVLDRKPRTKSCVFPSFKPKRSLNGGPVRPNVSCERSKLAELSKRTKPASVRARARALKLIYSEGMMRRMRDVKRSFYEPPRQTSVFDFDCGSLISGVSYRYLSRPPYSPSPRSFRRSAR